MWKCRCFYSTECLLLFFNLHDTEDCPTQAMLDPEEEEVAPPVESEEAPLTQVTILLSRINSRDHCPARVYKSHH